MFYIALIVLIFVGDLFIKNRVEKYIAIGRGEKEKRIAHGKLILRKHHNQGMMLNMGEKKRPVVAAVSLALTIALTLVFLLSLGHRGNRLLRLGLTLLLGGSFSNTYDRLRRKYVVDYLSFPVKWKWFRDIVFNISDFCIIIGALLAALGATR